MDRRTFVSASIAASVSVLAGCSSGGASTDGTASPVATDDPTEQRTETPTAEPTETPTEAPPETSTSESETTTASGERHPAARVSYEFYSRLLDSDLDAANEFVHPETPDSDYLPVTEENLGDTEGVTLIDARVDETDGEFAYVEVTLGNEGESPREVVITLRTYDGEWRVWASYDDR
ncbi:hypothetical protein JCM30237_29060 [Halolamina litorea]